MIKYKAGYKYQLAEDYEIQTSARPERPCILDYCKLFPNGMLYIRKGYAWDGPSGPTVDTKSFMRGSLVHDILYQFMYHELLPYSFKKAADKELVRICKEDGMTGTRRWWVYQGVKFGGDPRPSKIKKILTAP